MKLLLNTLGCPAWSLEEVAARAREYGYDGVDVRLLDGDVITPESLGTHRARLRRLFPPDALPIVTLGTSVRLIAADDDAQAHGEDDARAFLQQAATLGIPLVRVFGGSLRPGMSPEDGIAHAAASLARLAASAARAGVTVVLETHDDFSSADLVSQVLARVNSPAVGAIWDMHHTFRVGEMPAAALQHLDGWVANVHLRDARRRGDGWEQVLLGEGDLPVREVLRLLVARGYAGFVSVEWEKKWHPELPEPEIAFPQHRHMIRHYLSEMSTT